MSTSTVYRLNWKRKGWSRSKAGPHCYVSKRGAFSAAAKLEHATQRYVLEPIEELFIEEGTVHWSPHPVELPESLREHKDQLPAKDEPIYDERWTPKLRAVRERMLTPAAGYTEAECTFDAVVAFAHILEEQ